MASVLVWRRDGKDSKHVCSYGTYAEIRGSICAHANTRALAYARDTISNTHFGAEDFNSEFVVRMWVKSIGKVTRARAAATGRN